MSRLLTSAPLPAAAEQEAARDRIDFSHLSALFEADGDSAEAGARWGMGAEAQALSRASGVAERVLSEQLMVKRAEIVAAARLWLGTPYLHQAARRGAGTDCLGLIRGLWQDLAGAEPEAPPAYSPDWSEASGDERLWAAAERHLRRMATPGLGSVLLFRMRKGVVAKHLGIVSALGPLGPMKFIHAYSGQGVVETSFGAIWHQSLVAAFDFPWISD